MFFRVCNTNLRGSDLSFQVSNKINMKWSKCDPPRTMVHINNPAHIICVIKRHIIPILSSISSHVIKSIMDNPLFTQWSLIKVGLSNQGCPRSEGLQKAWVCAISIRSLGSFRFSSLSAWRIASAPCSLHIHDELHHFFHTHTHRYMCVITCISMIETS